MSVNFLEQQARPKRLTAASTLSEAVDRSTTPPGQDFSCSLRSASRMPAPVAVALFWRAQLLSALFAVLMLQGCSSTPTETAEQIEAHQAAKRSKSAQLVNSSIVGTPRQVTILELDQLAYGYADRYYTVVSDAVDAIKRGNQDPIQRRMAHQIKLDGVLSMNDIVSGVDPYTQIFDLVVSVTLQSIVWIDENRAEEVFGERAPGLIAAIRTMRVEAWDLAARVLTPDQLESLDYLILEWRRSHPEVEQVAFVKFDNFASARSASLVADLRSGGGFLAPLSEASQVLKDWRRLGERAFWYSKRAPNIAAIQAEGAVNEILAAPEINAVLQTADRFGTLAEKFPQTIDAQRNAFFAQIDERQTMLTNTLADVRHIVSDANALGGTAALLASNIQQTLIVLGDTMKVLDTIGQRYSFDKPPRDGQSPYNIQDYTVAFTRFNEAVTNLQLLSLSADQLSRSQVWKAALSDITDATDRRTDRIFSRICILLGIAFLLAIAYRIISLQLGRRIALSPKEKL